MKKVMQSFDMRRGIDVFVGVFAVLFGIKFISLSSGDVINSYPLISPDGFDWYTEGIYLVKLLSGAADLPILPILRPPVFVVITAIDYLCGGSGVILGLVFSSSVYGTYHIINKIIDFKRETNDRKWFAIPVAIATTIYPINYLKGYLLSDSICVFFSLLASYLFLKYVYSNQKLYLFFSAAIFLIAGLTQTYGLIPFIGFYGLAAILFFNSNRKKSLIITYSGLSSIALFILSTYIWRISMPHLDTPQNFELLKLSFEMFWFYLEVWGYYLVPFLLFLALSKNVYFRKLFRDNIVGLSSALIVITFLVFCFFYQWTEARFTYSLWVWLLVAVFVNFDLKVVNNKTILLLCIIMMIPSIVTPDSYWEPKLSTLRIRPSRNWVYAYFYSSSVDRKLNTCLRVCEDNEFLSNSDTYTNSVIKVYNQIK